MGVTMRDVAREAGVSVATVSRALAGSPLVAPDVRERVLRTAEEMSYVASRLPANMRARSALLFSLVVGNVRNPYFPDLIGGCEEAAQRAGYALIFGDSDEDAAQESTILRQMAIERVAGIALAAASGTTEGLRTVMAAGIPVVAVDRRIPGVTLDTVTVDNESGVDHAMQLLLDLGHRRIAMVGGPPHVSTASERQEGYVSGLVKAGIEIDPSLILEGDFRTESARALVTAVMGTSNPPTAIVTVNNLATIGTLQALRGLGLGVPRDVSVVGFDDLLTGELLDPPLTAIAQPTYEIGQKAIELLVRRITSPEAPVEDVVLTTTLLIRGSAGPVPRPERRSPTSGSSAHTDATQGGMPFESSSNVGPA